MSRREGPIEESREAELDLGALVDDVAAVQRPAVESAAGLRQVRSRLMASARVAHALPSQRSAFVSWLRGLGWSAAGMGVVAAFALWVVRHPGSAPLSFEASGPGVAAAPDTLLHAPVDAPLALRFSDGSTFTAAARSALAVRELRPQGARVVLDDGTVTAAVVHRATSRWSVEAGPYTVAVIGTRFAVVWNRRARVFSLRLDEGAVTVFGPSLGAAGRRVAQNETVRFAAEPAASAAASAPGEPIASPGLASAPAPALASGAPLRTRHNRDIASRELPARASWLELARAGRYADAVAAADAAGFATVCQQAPPAQLLLLGNAARFAQRPERADEAFQALRARTNGQHERAVAAFELGRVAHDVHRQYGQAADWFAEYLREEPDGALAREAAGRRLEALQRAGDADATRRAAQSYLASYPDGPYQSLARRVLAR